MSVVGARPQFVKAASVSAALAARAASGVDIEEILVHTGQHYDVQMSDVFFDELAIPAPRYNLAVGSGSHGGQTGEMMRGLEQVLIAERPDIVVVYGDTNSTLAASLVAAKLRVPVAHVEAGLRSFDRAMPEEINRVVTDHVSELLLCPSPTAVRNLASEGVTRGVHLVGDVMYDVLLRIRAASGDANPVGERLGLGSRPYAVVTVHRAANTDDPVRVRAIFRALARIAREGFDVVFPVHPRTVEQARGFDFPTGVQLIDPVGYPEMIALVAHARAVATDSGGLQKEAAWLGTPCVTLRDTTEWTETVDAGWNVLTDVDTERAVAAVVGAAAPSVPFTAYGDGDAGELVVDHVLSVCTRAEPRATVP